MLVRVKDPVLHMHEHIIASGSHLQLLGGALQGLLRRHCNCPRVDQVNGQPSISTAAQKNVIKMYFSSNTAQQQHSAAQRSTAHHSSPCEKSRKSFWTKLKVKMERQSQWTKHFPHADGQATDGPTPSQVGNTALSMGRALASKGSQCHGAKVFGLATAMFCLLRAIASFSCILGK